MADSTISMGVPKHSFAVSEAFGFHETGTESLASQVGTRGAWGCPGGFCCPPPGGLMRRQEPETRTAMFALCLLHCLTAGLRFILLSREQTH